MKNIVICSDGTGNAGGNGNETNVWRIFKAIKRNGKDIRQVTFYDDGVGTESFKPLRLFAGAFGYGLSRNVKQLYTEICRVYEPGDKIYYFGFSRGAFTVRTLMAWVLDVGLVDTSQCADEKAIRNLVNTSYRAFRAGFQTKPYKWLNSDVSGSLHKRKLGKKLFKLDQDQRRSLGHFIGIWDTVDAVGFPIAFIADWWNTWIYPFKFPDYFIHSDVKNAYHALAIDDERHTFHPLAWDESVLGENQNLNQVWFSGMHANVGGGYPQDGMAYVSLNWIIDAAQAFGLHFNQDPVSLFCDRANAMEKMYDSRSGPGIYYRFSPRNLTKIASEFNLKQVQIHESVVERLKLAPSGYTPRHLPADFVVTPSNQDNKVLGKELRKAILDRQNQLSVNDISQVTKGWDLSRVVVQWAVMTLSLLFMIAGVMCNLPFFDSSPWTNFVEKLLTFASDDVNWTELLIQAGVFLVISLCLSVILEAQANNKRSRFWKNILKDLS